MLAAMRRSMKRSTTARGGGLVLAGVRRSIGEMKLRNCCHCGIVSARHYMQRTLA